MFGYRILAILMAAIAVLVFSRHYCRLSPAPTKSFFWTAYIWFSVAALGLLWAPSREDAMREVLDLTLGLVVVLAMAQFGADLPERMRCLLVGWALAFGLTAIVAVWEVSTGGRLPAIDGQGSRLLMPMGSPFATFNNPNDYAAFLSLAFPFLGFALITGKSPWVRSLMLVALISIPCLLMLTGARLVLIGFAVQLLVFAAFRVRTMRDFLLFVTVTAVSGSVGYFVVFQILSLNQQLVIVTGSTGVEDASLLMRWNMIRNGLEFLWHSYGIGVGPGGYENYIEAGRGPYPTGIAVNPHNLWIEIASQYGVVVIVLFVLWLFSLSRLAYRSKEIFHRRSDRIGVSLCETVLLALIGYFFAAISSSSYAIQAMNWAFIGSLLAVCVAIDKRKNQPTLMEGQG
jgi:teichuronic acid biosynthesis protein TuaE